MTDSRFGFTLCFLFAPVHPAMAPRGASAAALAHGDPRRYEFTVASFNMGFEQTAISSSRSSSHCAKFVRVCARIVENSDADLLFACEVGASRKGLRFAEIEM